MDSWDGWPFARLYLLLVAGAFLLIGAQVFLFHWRGGFRKWTMWGPVLMAPLLIAAGVVGAVIRDGWIGWAVLGVFVLGVLDGIVGVYEHVRGVAERIGGFSLRNLMAGPPVFLPASFLAVAATAVLAIAWRAL